MRKILIASLVLTGVVLLAGSGGSAAPVNNAALTKLTPRSGWTLVQYRGKRCHVRWRSWWKPCA